jgi:tetratricopeptide (TPR) repeat protein
MTYKEASGQRLLLELRARDAWNQRDYATAQHLAEDLAVAALEGGDDLGWWNATFLVSECLRKQGLMEESRATAMVLAEHPLTAGSKALSARVSTLVSFALQGSGDLAMAVAAARQAVRDASGDPDQTSVHIEAQNALIAALADSDQFEAAWQECLVLVDLLRREPDSKYAGQSYWAIGNVAFLLKHITEGVTYHQLAAKSLSPINDLDLWARFNRASAALRLTAGVIEPETLECIERAELASSIVGGTDRDRLELSLTRAQWLVLTGQFDAAIDQLGKIIGSQHLLATHTAAEAHFLLGRAQSGQGGDHDAVSSLEASEELFIQSGAQDRAATARTLIDSIRNP